MAGHQVGRGEVQEDQIRVHADLDHPALLLAALGSRAADRGHHQGGGGGQGLGVHVPALGQQGGGLDLLKHVETVVRGGAVGAEGHVHPGIDHRKHVGPAGGQLEIGDRAVDRGDAPSGEQPHILRLQPDAVRGHRVRVEHMVTVEELGRGQTVFFLAGLLLLLCLGEVDVHSDPLVDREFGQGVPEVIVGGVFGVDRGLDLDPAAVVPVPFLLERDQLLTGRIGLKVEILGEQGRAAGEVRLDPGLGDRLGDRPAVVVHIRDRGRAEAQAFRDRQQGRRLDGAVVELRLPGKDVVVEPGMQVVAVGVAPQQAHGQVGVAVDQTRHQDHALAVHDLLGLLLRGGLLDPGDLSVRDAHKGPVINVHRLVHGDDGDVGKQCIHSNPLLISGGACVILWAKTLPGAATSRAGTWDPGA